MSKVRNMLFIRNERGEIIGAQVEEPSDAKIQAFISPAKPEHTLHRILDVPKKISDLAHPVEFHQAITQHFNSANETVTQITIDELRENFIRFQASLEKKSKK